MNPNYLPDLPADEIAEQAARTRHARYLAIATRQLEIAHCSTESAHAEGDRFCESEASTRAERWFDRCLELETGAVVGSGCPVCAREE
jgi:hypothetical protein